MVGLCAHILTIAIFLVIYGRMIEIYLVISIGPIPFATMVNYRLAGLDDLRKETAGILQKQYEKGRPDSRNNCTVGGWPETPCENRLVIRPL